MIDPSEHDFNASDTFDDIRKLERALAQRDALVKALEKIAAMDPKGIRADDLGRAARIAREALDPASAPGESASE